MATEGVLDLKSVLEFLAEFSWVHSHPVINYFTDDISDKIPTEWKDFLVSLRIEELNEIPFQSLLQQKTWPASFSNYVQKCRAFSLDREQTQLESAVAIGQDLSRGMSPKKKHEVTKMAVKVDEICELSQSDVIVDVGSGLGYLGHVLHECFGRRVVGVEGNDGHVLQAEKRSSRQGFSTECFKTINFSMQPGEDNCDKLTGLLRETFASIQPCSHYKQKPVHRISKLHDKLSNRGSAECLEQSNKNSKQKPVSGTLKTHSEKYSSNCQVLCEDLKLYNKTVSEGKCPPGNKDCTQFKNNLKGHCHISGCDKRIQPESDEKDVNSSKDGGQYVDHLKVHGDFSSCDKRIQPESDEKDVNSSKDGGQYVDHLKVHGDFSSCDKRIQPESDEKDVNSSKDGGQYVDHLKVHGDFSSCDKRIQPESDEKDVNSSKDGGQYVDHLKGHGHISNGDKRTQEFHKNDLHCHKDDLKGNSHISFGDKTIQTESDEKNLQQTLKQSKFRNIDSNSSDSNSYDSNSTRDDTHNSTSDDSQISEISSFCLIGLHCCGDLTPMMLEYFLKTDHARTLCLVSCCYHKMKITAGRVCNFPMSETWKSAYKKTQGLHPGFVLNCCSLRLAAQETRSRWKFQTAEEHKAHSLNVGFRALLEFFFKADDEEHMRAVISRKRMRNADFSSFPRFLFSVLRDDDDFTLRYRSRLNELYSQFEKKFLYIEIFTCIQVLMQPVLESVICLDRRQWMEEHGIHANIVPIFDDNISPRNLAMIAIK